jgi:2-polyprenyl-3-methyl-5-hydroxy-6-metoxy-1,4-benzoquinol methylase
VEAQRLRSLEGAYDEGTKRLIQRVGNLAAKRCLEVGAGAGSVASWLSTAVGVAGHVTAVDLDTRFLQRLLETVQVLQGDIRDVDLGNARFDLVHARFVLIHNAEAAAILDQLLENLAPGGYLALEEPDFSTAQVFAGDPRQGRAFENVNRAIERLFASRGQQHAFGRMLPQLLCDRGLRVTHVESESPVARGASAIANIMEMSTRQLAAAYLATGCVSQNDLDAYSRLAKDESCWVLYHSVVRTLARQVT